MFFTKIYMVLSAVVLAVAAPSPTIELEEHFDLVKRQYPDFGNYLYISEQVSGTVGQNIAAISFPANRAICPYELIDLQGCSNSFESECIPERWRFQWCLQQRLPADACGSQYLDMTIACTGGDRESCRQSLMGLYNCSLVVPIPSAPPVPSDPAKLRLV